MHLKDTDTWWLWNLMCSLCAMVDFFQWRGCSHVVYLTLGATVSPSSITIHPLQFTVLSRMRLNHVRLVVPLISWHTVFEKSGLRCFALSFFSCNLTEEHIRLCSPKCMYKLMWTHISTSNQTHQEQIDWFSPLLPFFWEPACFNNLFCQCLISWLASLSAAFCKRAST